MKEFEKFASNKSSNSSFYKSIIGKVFEIAIPDLKINKAIKFGHGFIESNTFNKQIIVESSIMWKVITGQSLFENLTTGYLAEVNRRPKEVYNRDIFIYIAMFSYYYKARILKLPINKII